MTLSLTPRMKQALTFIRSYSAENGIVPTFDEIAAGLGLKSKSRAWAIVHGLEERGAIRLMTGGKARCIMIDEPDAQNVKIPHDLFRLYSEIAKRENTSPETVIRDVLRSNAEGVA